VDSISTILTVTKGSYAQFGLNKVCGFWGIGLG
jgi:hypothetical protein